jgi:hypothetical protein
MTKKQQLVWLNEQTAYLIKRRDETTSEIMKNRYDKMRYAFECCRNAFFPEDASDADATRQTL